MPKLTVDNRTVDVEDGKRLVLAIEEQGIHIGHRCGGNARCTTCRVEFKDGEPDTMTAAEYAKLEERGLMGQYRLSCQIVCDHDMSVHPAMTLESEGWSDTGPTPEPTVMPEAKWYPKDELQRRSGTQ
jgi:ferredoxin